MDKSWQSRLSDVMKEDWFQNIEHQIKTLRQTTTIYPKEEDIYNALSLPFDNVKVIILGQDPYHGIGQAHGLSFSVKDGIRIPPSLLNIFKEARILNRKNGDLSNWKEQGVLLLNSVLTVEEGKPNSHSNLGWQKFTSKILQTLVNEKEHLIFLSWGRSSQNIVKTLNVKKSHLVLSSSHPSPLGCNSNAPIPFVGCNHFTLANNYLKENKMKEIDW